MAQETKSDIPGGQGLFVRNATGLVREAGRVDTIFFNWIAAGGIGLALVYNVYWALNAFPGVNLIAASLAVVPLAICGVLVFALLAASIPRSGGDYIFVSRIVNPVWGFIESFTGFISVILYSGWVAWFTAVAFIPAALGVLAQSFHSSAIASAATWSSSKTGSVVIAGVVLLVGVLVMLQGLKVALRAITFMAIFGLIGLTMAIIVLLLHSHSEFVSRFNAYGASEGVKNAYGAILAQGGKVGVAVPSSSAPFFSSGIPVMVISFYALGYAVWSIYFAGEMKQARSRSRELSVMIIPTIANVFVYVIAFALTFKVVGYPFVSSASYLYNYAPAQYPLAVPPFLPLFASVLSGSTFVNVIISVSWIMWPVAMVFLTIIQFSRMIFAWSFDGLLPERMSRVSPRSHQPTWAVIVPALLSFLCVVLIVEYGQLLTIIAYTVLLALIFWGSMAVAGIIMPYRRRQLYQGGPARWEIGKLPVITLAGVILFIWVIVEFYLVFKYPGLGITNTGQAVAIVLGVMGVGALIFLTYFLMKRRRGYDPMLVFKEIPPE
ncbi:MAG: amino acid permease [Actinomycetota bacterium]